MFFGSEAEDSRFSARPGIENFLTSQTMSNELNQDRRIELLEEAVRMMLALWEDGILVIQDKESPFQLLRIAQAISTAIKAEQFNSKTQDHVH